MAGSKAAHSERLYVPLRWWLQGTMLIASFWLAMVVAIPEAAAWAITAALMVLLALCLWWYGAAARVVVVDGWLHAGRARIHRDFIGEVTALDSSQTRDIAGPRADARAYLLLRPYLPQAVRVAINDAHDPTPYWLVSSRHAASLAAALGHARDQSPGSPLELLAYPEASESAVSPVSVRHDGPCQAPGS